MPDAFRVARFARIVQQSRASSTAIQLGVVPVVGLATGGRMVIAKKGYTDVAGVAAKVPHGCGTTMRRLQRHECRPTKR